MGFIYPQLSKIISIWVIVTCLTYTTMNIIVVSSKDTNEELVPNTITISDFNNFRNYRDSGDILSLKTRDFISFQYTGSETEMGEAIEIYEWMTDVYFHFFNITITINHHAVSSFWGEFNFSIKQVIESDASRFVNRKICFFSIGDYETSKPGYCLAGSRINSSYLKTEIVDEIITRNEILTFSAYRQENEIKYTLKTNRTLLINETAISDDLKLVNCLELSVFTGTENCNFNIITYEIKGIFSTDSFLPTASQNTSLDFTNKIIILFISVLIFGVKISYQKKIKNT